MKRNRRKRILIVSLIIILGFSIIIFSKNAKSGKIKPLTMEQKLEDFEYLYDFIADNSPFLKVNERVNGVNWLGEKEKFKSKIEEADTDEMFISEIGRIIRKLNNPHTYVFGDMDFLYLYSFYSDEEYKDMYKPWFDTISDEKVLKRYEFDEEKLEGIQGEDSPGSDVAYCKTDIIIPNKVAYLKIEQMRHERIEKDGAIIREFLGEIKDYDKLIIDIRNNPGGSDLYWKENIAEPLINKKITVENYGFIRGDYGKSFYEHTGTEIFPVTDLDKNILNNFPDEIETDFKYYLKLQKTIEPVDPIGFDGKIYLIVNNKVYSAAESFASFCKDSDFATLVGGTTGKDGIGTNPLVFSLPNSGLIINFNGILGLNGDGTINAEVGIIPDVEINPAIGATYERDQAIQYIIND